VAWSGGPRRAGALHPGATERAEGVDWRGERTVVAFDPGWRRETPRAGGRVVARRTGRPTDGARLASAGWQIEGGEVSAERAAGTEARLGPEGTEEEPAGGADSAEPDWSASPMRLYETSRQAIVPFEPGPIVRLYTCGITPYDAAHLGHAATYLAYDVLQRRLRDRGHLTRCVRNVTDVDDDILRRSRELGVHYLDLAAEEMARFDEDLRALGLLPAWREPRATSAIPEILTFVETALERGHAYRAGGAVYFSVATFPSFGQVSHLEREEMLRLAAERGGRPEDPAKRDPLDFVLWQPSLPDEPAWESRYGPGRPGWHIECSALAVRELGSTIDLHGGGSDLVFPHHECEAAQSEAVTGQPFVRHWMHVGMVHYEGEKMSKSLGNLVFVHDLLKEHEPAAIRLALLSRHYRTSWEWHPELLAEAESRLKRWRRAGVGSAGLAEVRARLDDDLDTPGALSVLDEEVAHGRGVSEAAELLGVA